MQSVQSLTSSSTIALTFAATLLAASAHAKDFRVADTQPENYPTVQALKHMGEIIERQTNGRHRLLIFHSAQLGEESETIEQTRAGAIDLNRTNAGPMGAIVPIANVLALPFLFRSVEHLHDVLDGPTGDEILDSFAPYGFIALTFYDSGARSLYNSVRPIRTLADVKGLRIRVQQSTLMIDMMKALGAEPVALPYGQVITGLRTGLIDGAENNWPSFVTTDHFRHAKYYTVTQHTMSPEVLLMSQRAWDGLSAEDRTIFRDAARESNRFMRAKWEALEKDSQQQALAAGIVVVTDFDRTPFEKAMSEIQSRVALDPTLGPLVERIKQTR